MKVALSFKNISFCDDATRSFIHSLLLTSTLFALIVVHFSDRKWEACRTPWKHTEQSSLESVVIRKLFIQTLLAWKKWPVC
jgi:hypothetical protein